MSSSVPPSAHYEGMRRTQAALAKRREEIQHRQAEGLKTVDRLVREQKAVSAELTGELARMQAQGTVLDEIEARQKDTSLLAALTRQLTRRRTMLEQRSVTEGLIAQYEQVSRHLRRATAFSDELRLCAVDLQHQVDELHEDLARSLRDEKRCAERIRELEQALAEIEGRTGRGAELSAAEREQRLDRLTFELRSESITLELFMAEARMARQHLDPARQLRDTVLSLQEDMARFVVAATATVNSSGRRIQALGMAADAPVVVGELQQSLEELREVMEATEAYVEQSQDLLNRVLPELSRRLEAQGEVETEQLSSTLESMSRERSRALAEQALREAAEAEVDETLELGRTL